MPRVRERVAELGEVPSRNQIMREFKVGARKASMVREALADGPPAEPAQPPEHADRQTRPLRSVSQPTDETIPDSDTPDPAGLDPVAVRDLTARIGQWATELGRYPSVDEILARFELTDRDIATRIHSVMSPGWTASETAQVTERPTVAEVPQVTPVADPDTAQPAPQGAPAADTGPVRTFRRWPLVLLALPAFVSIWGGWVGLGRMTGFGPIVLLPGIWDELVINSAITLPIGVEAYAAFAMSVWLSSKTRSARTRAFAMWSALGSLALGMAGQVAYHLMSAAGITTAPWQITTFVSSLPVVVLGCGAALLHLMHEEGNQ